MNALREKSVKSIEWRVRASHSVLVSDTFWIQERECRLELTIGDEWDCGQWGISYKPSYLYFKSNAELQSPVKITVLPPLTLKVVTQEMPITSVKQEIWSYSGGNLLNWLMTFKIIIEADPSKGEFLFLTFFSFYKISYGFVSRRKSRH